MENFINKFKEIIDEPCVSEITPDTIFREIDGWDSIMALSLIGMVDEEYDVTLNAEDLRSSKTLRDIFDRIESKK